MSNKLTFKEWKRRLQDECYNSDCTTDCDGCEFSVDKLSAWNFAQAQEQKEIEELKKKVAYLEAHIEYVLAPVGKVTTIKVENPANIFYREAYLKEKPKRDELKKKVEELEKIISSQTEVINKLENECSFTYKCPVNSNLQEENEALKKKLEEAFKIMELVENEKAFSCKSFICDSCPIICCDIKLKKLRMFLSINKKQEPI